MERCRSPLPWRGLGIPPQLDSTLNGKERDECHGGRPMTWTSRWGRPSPPVLRFTPYWPLGRSLTRQDDRQRHGFAQFEREDAQRPSRRIGPLRRAWRETSTEFGRRSSSGNICSPPCTGVVAHHPPPRHIAASRNRAGSNWLVPSMPTKHFHSHRIFMVAESFLHGGSIRI